MILDLRTVIDEHGFEILDEHFVKNRNKMIIHQLNESYWEKQPNNILNLLMRFDAKYNPVFYAKVRWYNVSTAWLISSQDIHIPDNVVSMLSIWE